MIRDALLVRKTRDSHVFSVASGDSAVRQEAIRCMLAYPATYF